MGVVRREGDWRLVKVDEGLYDVTYGETTEATITTSDYDPGVFDDRYSVGVPIHEVDTPSEARDVFEEIAAGGSNSSVSAFGPSMDPISSSGGAEFQYSGGATGENITDTVEDLPPGGFALALLLTGGIVLYSSSFAVGSAAFYLGSGLIMVGAVIFGWASMLFSTEGAGKAWQFLTSVDDDNSNSTKSEPSDKPERTPPAPQSLKDELYFDRANQRCEWCEDRTDQPEVHHIEPRSEGGPNEPSNLIVLCPGCHAKADRGGISRTKLQSKVKRLMESSAS